MSSATVIERAPRWRLWAVGLFLAIGMGVIVLKAANLQITLGDDLRALAERQYVRQLKLSSPRGNIYDVKGRPLAVSVPVWSISAAPKHIDDPLDAAARLSKVIGVSEETLVSRLSTKRGFVWLKRRVSPATAEAVRALDIAGIRLKKEAKRFYPNRSLAGQTIGLVGIDGQGRSGIEKALDEHLRGRSVVMPGLRDNRGRHVALASGVDLEVLEGDDVVVTLDARVQHIAEAELLKTMERTGAKAAFAIVLDAKTSAVRALASVPRMNPNDPGAAIDGMRLRPLSDVFEPGSIFKIATFAAALDAEVLTPDDSIFCENGKYKIGKHVIHDSHRAGWLSARNVFRESSNIGAMKIAMRLGEEPFKEAVQRYGFGEPVGLGLIEESAGRLPRNERWGETRLATVAFGYGIQVTAIQMAALVAAISQDGIRRAPHLLERVEAPGGETVKSKDRDDGERIMSVDVAKTMTDIMKGVVAPGGTGTLAAVRGIEVAGKTGTAEKVDPVTRRYSKKLNRASFIGFAPADAPEIVALVVVDEPREVHSGGAAAGPAWRAIVEEALVQEGILTAQALDGQREEPVENAWVTRAAAHNVHHGSLETSDVRPVSTAPGSVSLFGLSAREAVVQAAAAGFELEMSGTGVVTKQSPGPDAVLSPGSVVHIVLEPRP